MQWEKHFIRVRENLSKYPHIIHPFKANARFPDKGSIILGLVLVLNNLEYYLNVLLLLAFMDVVTIFFWILNYFFPVFILYK